VPTELTSRQRELLEELGRELGEDVQPQQRSFMEKLRDLFG
jgi:molecular chaperone DnaJ